MLCFGRALGRDTEGDTGPDKERDLYPLEADGAKGVGKEGRGGGRMEKEEQGKEGGKQRETKKETS